MKSAGSSFSTTRGCEFGIIIRQEKIMISKTLKTRKKKLATKKTAPEAAEKQTPSVVLAGTYKDKQLDFIERDGIYNYPIGENDKLKSEDASKVKELWLYAGRTKVERKVFAAEFVGIQTREEFLAAHPKYPKGSKSKHTRYLVFKVEKLDYGTRLENPLVFARAADFTSGKSAKIAAAIKQFEKDGDFASLADYLPEDLGAVPRKQLRVCEAAVQITFFEDLMRTVENASILEAKERPIAIDLFAGCGGLSLGFEQAGFDIAAAVEIDPIHAAAHEFNFPYSKTICADIKNISGADIRQMAGIGDREVDVVFGGAPCQGFSMIGKRALDDPRNQLIGHYLRIVRDIQPKFCVLENVKGLTVGAHKQFLAELIEELGKIDYHVLLPYRVLNAADYGVPQNRERLFLVAARGDQKIPKYPEAKKTRVTIREAISDLPDADGYEQLLKDDSVSVKWKTSHAYAKELRGQKSDETNFGYAREFDKNKLTSSWRTLHGEISQARFLAAPQGETEPHSRFFKLAWDGQSNTLRAGTDSARGGFTSPRPIHPVLPRVITVREAARIHSYPDWFRFNKTKWHGFREIGNSVPPRLARAVGRSIMDSLGIIPTKPTKVIKPGDESLLEFDMRAAADYFGVSRHVIAQRTRKNDGK